MDDILRVDVLQVLNYVRPTEEIHYNDSGYSATRRPSRIRRMNGSDLMFVDAETNEPYPMERIMGDIYDRKLSIGAIIQAAEKNSRFRLRMRREGVFTAAGDEHWNRPKQEEEKKDSGIAYYTLMATMPPSVTAFGVADSHTQARNYILDVVFKREKVDEDTRDRLVELFRSPVAVIRTYGDDKSAVVSSIVPVEKFDKEIRYFLGQAAKAGKSWVAEAGKREAIAAEILERQKRDELLYVGDAISDLYEGISPEGKANLDAVMSNYHDYRDQRKITINEARVIAAKKEGGG